VRTDEAERPGALLLPWKWPSPVAFLPLARMRCPRPRRATGYPQSGLHEHRATESDAAAKRRFQKCGGRLSALSGQAAVEEVDLAHAAVEVEALIDRQLEAGEPFTAGLAERVGDRRALTETARQHALRLVSWRACGRARTARGGWSVASASVFAHRRPHRIKPDGNSMHDVELRLLERRRVEAPDGPGEAPNPIDAGSALREITSRT
jgi:hypothetical protein